MFKSLTKIKLMLTIGYLIIVSLLVIPSRFQVVLPGDTTLMSDQVYIEDHTISHISSIYVISYEPITLFQLFMLHVTQQGSVFLPSQSTEIMTLTEKYKAAQVQKLSSYIISTIVAYEKAQKDITYVFDGFGVTSLINEKRTIQIGDVITSINGIKLTQETDFTQFANVETLTIQLMRNNEALVVTHERQPSDLPLALYPMFTLIEVTPNITFPGLSSTIGGPSGGVMMTLAIYLAITDLMYDARIVGTGTIQLDGSIGNIGGLVEKYQTVKDDMEIMFVPEKQIHLLLEYNDERIVGVSSIDDVIHYLDTHDEFMD
ncbi:MAG: S16 family serine protease [Acholeplasmataceae bacterium]|jgi:PDZ domain-containing protein